MRSYRRLKFNWEISFVIIIHTVNLNYAVGAPCCARSSATPIMIVGDDLGQLTIGVALGNVIAENTNDGVPTFLPPDVSESRLNYRMDGAFLLSDRLQLGAGVSLVKSIISRPNVDDSSYGLGDTRISLGYEVLPEWSYSLWKPQGFLFSVITLPTGRSLYQSQKPTSSDIFGNGFYMVSVGTLLLKRWSLWDVYLLPEVHYSFSRTFESPGGSIRVAPNFGGSFGVGVGYSPGGGAIRVGVRFQPTLDQGRTTTFLNLKPQVPSLSQTCDTGFDVAYLMSSSKTLMFSYTDQTLLGPASNANLSRIFALNFQHRWER